MEATLAGTRRSGLGKNQARRLRREGRVPGVLYGGDLKGQQPEGIPIAVDPKTLLRILHSESGVNTLIALDLDGGRSTQVMVKEYQLDPISHQLLHVDFFRVAMDKPVTVTVPIVLKGEARGVRQQGGLLDFMHRDVEIESLPAEIPEHIEIDVSELLMGQGIRVRDLPQTGKWRPISDPDMLLLHVIAPKAEEPAPVAAEAPAAAEPEVMKRGKTEQEEG